MSLPSGTVTFLFTDIEGSTRLLQQLGDGYADVQRAHRQLLRTAAEEHAGHEVDTQGDSFFFSFSRARDAVAGAVAAQTALAERLWPDGIELRVRMGLHTGEPTLGDEGYLGLDVVRAVRLCEAGHGGQILISETTRALLGNELPNNVVIADLGEQKLKDIQHEHVFQVVYGGQPAVFPPLRTEEEQEDSSRGREDFSAGLQRDVREHVRRSMQRAAKEHEDRERTSIQGIVSAAAGFAILFILALTIIAIVVVARWAF